MRIIDFKAAMRYFNWRDPYGPDINAHRDWKVVNIIFATIFFIMLVTNGFVAWKNFSVLKKPTVLEEKKQVTVDKTSLSAAMEQIKKKRDNFEKKTGAPMVNDPSL